MSMLSQILFWEWMIKRASEGLAFNDDEWRLYSQGINQGRELLDRKFVRAFFGGGPRGINKRVRKSLIATMLKVDKEFPKIKGQYFDSLLKDLMRKDCA